MAQRRMISKDIHQSGLFIGLHPTSKILYDDLVLYADDDGFCTDTVLINLMDKAQDDNYKELSNANLIINMGQAYLIVDWLNTQILNHYTRTSHLDLSSHVYIRIDFRYTINPNDENIALSLDKWVEEYKRSRQIDLKSLQRQRLSSMVNKRVTSGNHNGNPIVAKGSPSIDKNSIDKSRLEKTRTDQTSKDKNKVSVNQTTSSNGGMGETTSSKNSSSINIIKIIANSKNDTEGLINYINKRQDTNIPTNNKRLNVLFTDLLNQFKLEYVEKGLVKLLDTIKDPHFEGQYVENLIATHLADSIKTVAGQKEDGN